MTTFEERTNSYENQRKLEKIFGFPVPREPFLTAVAGKVKVDIVALDDIFSKQDEEYNGRACMYKGKTCSMSKYVEQKWGKEVHELLKTLL